MQSGHGKTGQWILEALPTSARLPEPLMGWTSADDTLAQIKLKFKTREEAIAHAERQGWEYSIAVNREPNVRPRSYMDNFKYIAVSED